MTINRARFLVNGTPSEDENGNRGFVATHSQTITLTLEQAPAIGVTSVRYELTNPDDSDSPQASKSAPTINFTDSETPSEVPAGTNDEVTFQTPASGIHSYTIRCTATKPDGTQDIFERLIVILTEAGLRKTVPAERTEFAARGWSDAINDMIDVLNDAEESAAPNDWTFTFGDFNVAVVPNASPQNITLATLNFANLPGQVGDSIDYGGSGHNCTGFIDVWVCFLDETSGDGINKEFWFRQKVNRRLAGPINTRGDIVFDELSDEAVDGDPEFTFTDGSTMPITVRTTIPYGINSLVVRVRGKLTNKALS